MKTVFITGAGSGFGFALARRLLARGERVIATDEQVEGWPNLLGRAEGLRVLQIDVRSDAAVEAGLRAALGWSPVDVLVNNAGIAVFAAQEEAPIEAVRDLFDVNVFGPMRVTKALLPTLRERGGQVVQISSVAGRTVFPESGFYAATKHALEAMSEALVQEAAPFGVRVHLVQPGAFETGFQARAARLSPAPPVDSPYAEARARWMAGRAEVLEPPQDPEQVVDAILAGLDDLAPFRRTVVGRDAERILSLREALAQEVWTRLGVDRNGFVGPHAPTDVPGPEEIGSVPAGDPRLERARLADRYQHLGHYGTAALDRVRRG